MAFWTSFALGGVAGLAAAPHCLVMCGPLAAYACRSGKTGRSVVWYLSGRLLSYVFIGAVVGHAGAWILSRVGQPWLSAALSWSVALVLVFAAWKFFPRKAPRQLSSISRTKPRKHRSLLEWIAPLVPQQPWAIGLATGLLPCGALAAALLLSANTQSAGGGASLMFGFALASAPALLGVGLFANALQKFTQGKGRYILAVTFLLGAVVFVWRPLNSLAPQPKSCCHGTNDTTSSVHTN